MRFRLRTLVLATFVGPLALAILWWIGVEIVRAFAGAAGTRAVTPPRSPLFRAAVCSVVVLYPLAGVLLTLAIRLPSSQSASKPLELAALVVAAIAAIATLALFIVPMN